MIALTHGLVLMALAGGLPVRADDQATAAIDQIVFGDAASEERHHLEATASDRITGGLQQSARRLLNISDKDWQGGNLSFTIRVDPVAPTYATVRFWGSESSPDRLFLFCEGRQIGYRHLGDIDILDVGSHESPCAGRFYDVTTPLPQALTAGKTEVHCEIRSSGPIWGYGDTWEHYQKMMTEPTRGIYRIATHTAAWFLPPPDEIQADVPADPPLRSAPGPEVLTQVQERVNHEIDGELANSKPLNQVQLHFLARAASQPWTHAYHNPQVAAHLVAGLDHLYADFRTDPNLVRADKAVYNSEWFAAGMAADALRLLADEMTPFLDQPIASGGPTRRVAWSALFQDSRDHLRHHRRLYTNQSMIVDMNIYRCNRAVAAIDPSTALPERQALRYLREAIGIDPWLGSDTESGSEKPMGDHYRELTAKGLTRELGYVGYYGEVIDWVTQIYEATCDPGHAGDPDIKAQLIRIANARAIFRYPMVDADGARAMRIEAVVGWRDDHYPGDVTYAERPTWDASPLYEAAATLDPHQIGAVQQQIADHQLFAAIAGELKEGGLRTTAGLLGIPGQYQTLLAQPPQPYRLPMTPGQPDVIFADEEDGVIAIKHGTDILYASLYWRARSAVNHLARIHLITSTGDRIAVVLENEVFTPSGLTWKRPDWTDFGFASGGHRYPVDLHSAEVNEELPIAAFAAEPGYRPGNEHPLAGRASFYECHFGRYTIGMNASTTQSFPLHRPNGQGEVRDLTAANAVITDATVMVAPLSTTVLFAEHD